MRLRAVRVRVNIHLRELISNFFDLFSLLADDCPMELLLHNQVFGALVFLETGKKCKHQNVLSLNFCQTAWLNEWMNQPKIWPYSHHSLDHLNEFSACQLDPFRVPFDPDQTTSIRVLGDSHRHFILLLDAVDCREEEWAVWAVREGWKKWGGKCILKQHQNVQQSFHTTPAS